MNNIYVFKVEVNRYGTNEKIKELFFLGLSLFQISHIATEKIFEESMFKFPVEISSISRVSNIGEIENPELIIDMMEDENEDGDEHNHYTGDIPLNIAKNLTDEQTISFDCECHERLRIPAQMGFPFLICPNCQLEIKPSEIKNAGGIYFYEKEKGRK